MAAALVGLLILVGLVTIAVRSRGLHGAADQVTVENPPLTAAATAELPFKVPPGYTAERVAGPPLITHPMFACFDDQGRLYVAGSSGHNLGPAELTASPPDAIRRLEDVDGDGRFDRSSVFANKLTYPQGVLWHQGAVFTASPPSVWRLDDTDGDGVADRRRELVTGFPFTGIADDLHGPTLGPDGRIYWGVGRFDYQIRIPRGPLIRRGKAPLIMRCRPDGTDIEVFSCAMGNPVEVAFSPEGEGFACGTFLAPESMGQGLRDAVIHCVLGGVYSVRDRALNEDKRTGDPLPPLSHLGVAAGSGIMRARSEKEGSLVLYSALFNMHKVERHTLKRDGATFQSHNEDFLVSEDPDFHPTDVLEDADGSILVVDTGAWFRSCPTSQIARANVLGAIYRIRRIESEPLADPRGHSVDWANTHPQEMVKWLDDPRFAVRERAVEELVNLGFESVPSLEETLEKNPSVRARRNALWALARIDEDPARAVCRTALKDPDRSVRQAAAVMIGLNRDNEAIDRLLEMVKTDEPPVRREAASALARLRQSAAVPVLLEALRSAGTDRFLEHALIYALITTEDRRGILPGLKDPSPEVRKGTLIALDQMEGGRLRPEQVIALLDPEEPELERAALRVLADHPTWADHMVGLFRRWLTQPKISPERRDVLRRQLVAFSQNQSIQDLMAALLKESATTATTRLLLLEAVAQAPFEKRPNGLIDAFGSCLADHDESVVRQAVETIRAKGIFEYDDVLLELAMRENLGKELRVEALQAVAPRLKELGSPSFTLLTSILHLDNPPLLRLEAARALGTVQLDPSQLMALATVVEEAGALILPKLLPAFDGANDPQVGLRLLAALEKSPGLRSLTPDGLRQLFEHHLPEVRQKADALARRLEVPEAAKAARIAEFQSILSTGDERQGREVFFGPRATCSTCHTVRTEGGKVGPDLSRIGTIRTGRDLLEAILFPSATFARGYEPFVIATLDGRTFTGLIARETADAIYLVTPDRVETCLPRVSIEAVEQARTSIMPQGLEGNLSRQELADLVAFLQSLK